MSRWLRRILAYIGITFHEQEISIQFRRFKIVIKYERSDPTLDTQKIRKDEHK